MFLICIEKAVRIGSVEVFLALLTDEAVELAVLMNVIAASNGFSGEDVRKLRESCEEQVKRINGTIRLDDAVRWQNS